MQNPNKVMTTDIGKRDCEPNSRSDGIAQEVIAAEQPCLRLIELV